MKATYTMGPNSKVPVIIEADNDMLMVVTGDTPTHFTVRRATFKERVWWCLQWPFSAAWAWLYVRFIMPHGPERDLLLAARDKLK